MSDLIIEALSQTAVEDRRIELVERKGAGHPDSMCDGIMEAVSVALCREYSERFGRILHHNIDKGLLVAGRSVPRLGGGKMREPMRLVFGDRATSAYQGKKIDLDAIAVRSAMSHQRLEPLRCSQRTPRAPEWSRQLRGGIRPGWHGNRGNWVLSTY
jgi:S-adenosylmethionine synthetase